MTTRRNTKPRKRRLRPPGGGHFEAVIFDMGGTLLEYDNITWPEMYARGLASVRRCLRNMGYDPPPARDMQERFDWLMMLRRERIRAEAREYTIGGLLRTLFKPYDLVVEPDEFRTLLDAYFKPISRQVSVYPESHKVLQDVSDAGYQIGLLSNTCFRVNDHRRDLERYGLWNFLDAAVFTSTLTYRKPHPKAFRAILKKLGVPAKRSLYIGDRQLEDVHGPQQIGMTAVLVRRPGKKYIHGQSRSIEIRGLQRLTKLLDY